jgi:hypothetical protein
MRLKPKKYAGAILDGDGWEAMFQTDKWVISIGPKKGRWLAVKVAFDGVIEHKANYWTAWDGERLAESKDIITMMNNRPKLYARLEEILIANNLHLPL